MNIDEAKNKIDDHLKNAYDELEKATVIADEFDIGFDFSLKYPGISGYYCPRNKFSITKQEALELVQSGKISDYEVGGHKHNCIIEALKKPYLTDISSWESSDCYGSYGWRSSSDDC